MNRGNCNKTTGLLHLIAGILLIIIFSSQSLASQITVACMEGLVQTDDISFPRDGLGNAPDRIANWELVFQKGVYKIRISSRFEFIPFIYKKVNGKYVHAGLPQRVNMQNDRSGNAFFYYDFSVTHANEEYSNRNWWLLQIKPVPEAQSIAHTIRLISKPVNCLDTDKGKVGGPCPPGQCDEGMWGMEKCKKSSPSCNGGPCGSPGCN